MLHFIEPAGIFWALKTVNLPDFKQTQRFIRRSIMANRFSIGGTADHPALKPFQLGVLALSNRAVVAPMSRVSTKGDGVATEAMATYYACYAKGGFGLIISEGTYTDSHFSQSYPNQPGIVSRLQQAGWRKVVQAVHESGGFIFLQLMHGGALSQHFDDTRGPSAIQPLRKMLEGYSVKTGSFPMPKAMTLEEIEEAVRGFVHSALAAKEVGFDGVEIHGANGYLLDQFLTEYTNMRKDSYGGSRANRVRLTAEIISQVREVVGNEFIVGVRLSQGKVNDFDYLWPDGLNDGAVIFEAVKRSGADYIHFASEGKGFDHGCLTKRGESLPKQARILTGLPVIANGGMHQPEESRRILTEGHADLVALGTGALANPAWPHRLANNHPIANFDDSMFAAGVTIEEQVKFETDCMKEVSYIQ
jgi:2,4-dienoyl-CoA reductase-like NADH-dependent reductase (Old Yellow Enzyme family)